MEQENLEDETHSWSSILDLDQYVLEPPVHPVHPARRTPEHILLDKLEKNMRSVSPASALASHDYADQTGLRKTFEVSPGELLENPGLPGE